MFDQLDLRSLLNAAFRQRHKFILVAGGILALGILYLMVASRAYQSEAKLLVKFGQDARPEATMDPRGNAISADEKRGLVMSNIGILTSRDLLAQLLKDVSIEKAYPKLAANPPAGMPIEEAAINKLGKDLQTTMEPEAGMITVDLFSHDPQQAQVMLKHLVDLFLDRQSQIYANPEAGALKEQSDAALTDLETANKALYDYKATNGLTSIDEELTLLLKQRGDLAGYLSRRQSTDSGSTTTSSSALPARMAMNGDTSRFPVIDDAQKRIDDLRAQEQQLLQTYNANSPLVQNVRRNIASESAALNRSVDVLNQQIESLDKQIADKHKLKSEFEDLSRRVEYASEAYKNAQDRLHTAEINNDLNQRKITRISIIEQPSLPYKSTRPNVPLILVLTVLVAGLLGAGVATMAEILDQRFSRWEQVFAKFGIPVVASFNRPDPSKPSASILSTDELGALYAAVAAKATPGQGSIVCVASSYLGEGCTTVGMALARHAAKNFGVRTLLVAETHEQLKQALEPKLPAAALSATGPEGLNSAIVQASGNNSIAMLFDKPGELTAPVLENVRRNLATLRSNYGLIVLTLPALLKNTSNVEFARMADSSMLVVEAERLRAPVVKQSIELFSNSRIQLLGLIFNKQRLHIPQWIYRRL